MSVRCKALASRSRIMALRSTAWDVAGEAACTVALWAFANAREAEECSSIVALRAEAMREAET